MSKPRKLRSRKAGLPPGSLVHIGEIKTARPSITVIDFGPDKLHEATLAKISELRDYHRQNDVLWINLYGVHEPHILAAVGEMFGLHPLVLEDILNTDQRQKVDRYDNYLYVVLHRYMLAAGALDLAQDQISVVVGRNLVLTFQERQSKTFEPVRQRLRAEHSKLRRGAADSLAYSLIDSVVDSYFGVIEQLNERAEVLEEEILGKPRPAALEGIHELKRCVSRLRRNLYPLREVVGSLYRDAGDFFTTEIQLYLRDVYDHAVHILESLEDLRDLATGLLDVYLSTVSHRVNLELRTLTVVATIFMPATLLAGIFGMNFKVMPWLDQPAGFSYVLGLMGAIAVFMLALFWRRRFV